MSYYLGIDIGTFESKGVITDASGNVVAQAARPHKMLVPRPGWAEHRPEEDWWGDFVHLSKALLAESRIDPKAIRAVGTSAIGPCMLPVDKAGMPLMNGVLYGVDGRAALEVDELTQRIGVNRLVAECGNALTSQSVGPKILWLRRNHPDLFDRTDKVMSSTSFIVRKLTGETVIDHYTAANFSPLYTLASGGWDASLADDIIDIGKLPRILWSTEIAGTVTAKASGETGLAAGTPVITGTIDAASEAVSVGVFSDSEMMLMYGSTMFFIMLTPERVADARLWYAPWLFKGQHASMAGLATSGTLTHWFRDQFARELDPKDAFPALAAEAAASPPGANGLLLLPYFSGERTPIHDPHAKGVLFGLNLTHGRGDVYRALLEGIAHGTAHVIDTWRGIGKAPASIYAVGGGVRNAVWSQAISDIAGIRQVVRRRSTGASFGNAFLGAMAVGDAVAGDIEAWNPVESAIEPSAEHSGLYARDTKLWRSIYERTRDLMAGLDTQS
jgi:xylulokinase